METAINIKGLKEDTTIKEVLEMENSLRNYPELKQIKNTIEERNKQVRSKTCLEKNKDFFNKLGLAYYE